MIAQDEEVPVVDDLVFSDRHVYSPKDARASTSTALGVTGDGMSGDVDGNATLPAISGFGLGSGDGFIGGWDDVSRFGSLGVAMLSKRGTSC